VICAKTCEKLSKFVKVTAKILSVLFSGHSVYSSNEPDELSQWLCHDDSTINIVLELLLLLFIIISVVHRFMFCIF